MNVVAIIRIVLIVFTLASLLYFVKDLLAHKEDLKGKHWVALAIIGLYSNFLDTWGIGSYATTQAGFKFTKSTNDETIPGTLNIGDTFPVALEAILFLGFVDIDPLTLVLMLAAATLGAVIGAGIVCKWNLKVVRYALGIGLIILAIVLFCKNSGFGPFGLVGTATGLTGIKLVIGVVINFFLGALMMIGVGLYAPCMALVSALGMNVGTAFPIMMGSCAFLMNAACFKFIKEGKYDRKAALALAIFGCIGVTLAYVLLKYAIDMKMLTYVVCVVMIITSLMFFKDARNS
ncbi:permease [Clostridiaceae bacterium 68-1-5]|uniref:Permease n=1 Tax=Suipraeoptans intestinalis TaxID=2606628 RepID=A0A6N7USL1_9FIRM|nr:permease [Suipraeoptans intestinalis]MDY3121638.1 permease [Suipraeoptans intestinalis]MSR93624.1 permease [Suipraeoptans intestinalis]